MSKNFRFMNTAELEERFAPYTTETARIVVFFIKKLANTAPLHFRERCCQLILSKVFATLHKDGYIEPEGDSNDDLEAEGYAEYCVQNLKSMADLAKVLAANLEAQYKRQAAGETKEDEGVTFLESLGI